MCKNIYNSPKHDLRPQNVSAPRRSRANYGGARTLDFGDEGHGSEVHEVLPTNHSLMCGCVAVRAKIAAAPNRASAGAAAHVHVDRHV